MESTNTNTREQLVNKIDQNSIKTHFNIQLDSARLQSYAEEEFHRSSSNHHHHPKGRRTKRHRSDNEYSSSSTTAATTQSNDNHDVISHITAEDDDDIIDLANCLILLAQGTKPNTTTTTTTTGCLYECKTCNRAFSSFQALGGHRASHKKPRPNSTPTVRSHPDHDDLTDDQDLSSSNNKTSTNNIRVHECSICGSEFPSGQALGGHMRRHRAPPLPTPLPDGRPIKIDGGGPRNVLPLDLNLPAPDDGEMINQEYMETKFHVLPTPTLVDCHY